MKHKSMLGPLNAQIQFGAIYQVSEPKSDSETSITASDWIGTFKGPNVCTQRFSCIRLHLFAGLFVSNKTSG